MYTTINEFRTNERYDNHNRVIPRDFFNESKLLKCMGQLALKILDGKVPEGITIEIEESGEPFNIALSGEYDCLYVTNYPVTVNGEDVFFGTTYNSKALYPMICYVDYEEFDVFDDQGNFTAAFIEQFAGVMSENEAVINEDIIHNDDNIPAVGETVKELSYGEYGDRVDILFSSGKHVAIVGDFSKKGEKVTS